MNAQRLLSLLSDPLQPEQPALGEWDRLVRIARLGSVASLLHVRYEAAGALDALPAPVLRQLRSERTIAEYRIAMTRWNLQHLAEVLGPLGIELVLLKGSAYVAQDAAWGRGRLTSDVDLLVRASEIGRAETALRAAGWRFGEISDYDERYFREWSHELPPLMHPERPLPVDLHHTILPVSSRLRPDAAALVDASIGLPGTALRVLAPHDQLLHTCCHLFEDSDLWHQMRDLLDLGAMLSASAGDPAFDDRLAESTARHGLQRPLHYGLRYARRLLDAPVPERSAREAARRAQPSRMTTALMDALVARSLLPAAPDRPVTASRRWAKRALRARYFTRRFPPRLLALHLWTKLFRPPRPTALG
ncbi:MAG: nucleotidyltransferase family protein [Burkholderiaceae bacterium]|nr:nucleotidyltransferase family protein [Burkholderiaceae bacterium]